MKKLFSTKANTKNKVGVIRKFITEKFHPCVMAQSVLQSENLIEKHYSHMNDKSIANVILSDLQEYISMVEKGEKNLFYSFAAVFEKDHFESEEAFEKNMWTLLNKLHAADDFQWDETVSHNPEDENFSFSLLGHAFYIIGLHPQSSRKARRCPKVTLVFNLHSQFENLRNMGVYQKVRDRIRKRDIKHQGSINPMLKDFGDDSEAKQYSGRKIESNWKCPFQFLKKKLA